MPRSKRRSRSSVRGCPVPSPREGTRSAREHRMLHSNYRMEVRKSMRGARKGDDALKARALKRRRCCRPKLNVSEQT